MRKNAYNSLPQLVYTCFLLCSLVLHGCSGKPDKTTTEQQSAVESLLQQADSLSQTELAAQLALLAAEQQSEFFSERLPTLENSGRMEELSATVNLYRQFDTDHPEIIDYYSAIYLQYKGLHDSADVLYLRAIESIQRNNDSLQLAKFLDTRAGNLSMMGRFDEAVAVKYQALNICHSIREEELAMYIQAFLANLYIKKREYEKAVELGQTPLNYFRKEGNLSMESYILLMQANAYMELNELDSSQQLHKQIQQIYYALGQPPNMNEPLYHYSRMLIKKGQVQEALDSLAVVKQRILASEDRQGLVFVDLTIAEALFEINRFNEASRELELCLVQANAQKLYTAAAAATKLLSTIKKIQGDYPQALHYLGQHLLLKDTSFNQERIRIAKELSIKYETAQKEQQITALQREITLSKQRNGWIAGTLVTLMLGILYILRTRFLRKQQQLKADKLIMETKTEMLHQQIKFQEIELANHQAQLQDYTQMLISKNKQLAEISRQQQTSSEDPTQIELEELYNSVIHTDKDWELFQTYFNKVHPGFIPNLKQRLPELSPAELRTILLGKMNLSLKEHAEILGVSIDAVKKSRYRLRKKYGLPTEGDFSALWKQA